MPLEPTPMNPEPPPLPQALQEKKLRLGPEPLSSTSTAAPPYDIVWVLDEMIVSTKLADVHRVSHAAGPVVPQDWFPWSTEELTVTVP